MDDRVNAIENKIDDWMYENLNPDIPRYKYIYHCNLAYIDIMVESKMLFSPFERHYLFSLNYNTHIAYMKLNEEDEFDYIFDHNVYLQAFDMILLGMEYSMLCDVFPLLHSDEAVMSIKDNDIYFDFEEMPKRHYKFINDFSMRKLLSYTLQMANGRCEKKSYDDEEIAMKLADLYMHFWNENMLPSDYEPYTGMDWGGISFFLILAAMRRFNKLYKKDFDIVSLDSQKMMILMSPNGVRKMRTFVPSEDDDMYELALKDHVYQPKGKGLFPKANITDAPLIRTKDGYIFANSLVVLFNDSLETQFLNYLRRCDNPRYLRIKDKIKERVIPLIQEMVKYKFSNIQSIVNFNVRMLTHKKNKRECDLLLVDNTGVALYLEIKHFYNPQSYGEIKVLDKELKKALNKMPDQLEAIKVNWEMLKKQHGILWDLKELYGVIVSHRYTGYNVDVRPETPIVNYSDLFESIAESSCLKEIYLGCREIDELYPKITFIQKEIPIDFAGYTFHLYGEALDPVCEIIVGQSYKKQIYRSLTSTSPTSYKNVQELARAYVDEIEKNK
ncbi:MULTISPECIES: hypothetical protein [Clostridia]|uniref:hypothetical protein n=1 Tax=Clostridia TaxID=186801 RepID=UPI001FA95DEB|nr:MULTISPECIES: hypothetical protein [Clostridia]